MSGAPAAAAAATAAAGSTAAAAAPPPLRAIVASAGPVTVRVAAARFVSSWRWDIPDGDVCGICHSEFERPCTGCKVAGDDCPPAWGACNHTFHMHCIMRWLEAPRPENKEPECPLCRRAWEFKA